MSACSRFETTAHLRARVEREMNERTTRFEPSNLGLPLIGSSVFLTVAFNQCDSKHIYLSLTYLPLKLIERF